MKEFLWDMLCSVLCIGFCVFLLYSCVVIKQDEGHPYHYRSAVVALVGLEVLNEAHHASTALCRVHRLLCIPSRNLCPSCTDWMVAMKHITPDIDDDPPPPPTNLAAVAAWEQRVLGRTLHSALQIARAVVLQPLEQMPHNQPPRWLAQRSYTLGRLRLAIEHMTQVMKTLGIKEIEDDTVDVEKEEHVHT